MIEMITSYRFDGKEFRDLKEVAKYVENEIGKVIDSTPNRLRTHDALAVYDAIVKHRKRLLVLLSAEYMAEEDGMDMSRSIFEP